MRRKLLLICLTSLALGLPSLAFCEVTFSGFKSSGHIEAFYFPKHNEYDPNPMIFPFSERQVARYGLDAYATIGHTEFLPNLFGFVDSFSLFGDTRPQTDYNYKANPIVMILTYGAGYQLNKHAQVRISTSRHLNLGGYKGERLLWSAVSVRWDW